MRIIACFASSLDGRIGLKAEPNSRIASPGDLEHLLTVRNQADAIMCGGETFRQHPLLRKGNAQNTAPLQCVLTRSVNLPPDARLFVDAVKQNPPTPILLVTSDFISDEIKQRYPSHIEWIVPENTNNPLPEIVQILSCRGIQTLMIEGGGYIFDLALKSQLVHELYLTLCPLLLSGQNNPGLVTGESFKSAEAPRTEVLSHQRVNHELYLHLKIIYPTMLKNV